MRVMHFVTGGFSGATQVAIDLCRAAACVEGMEVLLVLRRKRTTTTARVEALRLARAALDVSTTHRPEDREKVVVARIATESALRALDGEKA